MTKQVINYVLKFKDNNINITGVNALDPVFNRAFKVQFKRNNVVFLANDQQVLQLKHNLLVTGVAVDVKTYNYEEQEDTELSHEQHQDDGKKFINFEKNDQ